MIRFSVVGVPAPQGSKRHVGNGVMVESSKRVKPWRIDVKEAALDANPHEQPIAGAVALLIVFRMPVPSSAPKRRRLYASKRPDIDKLTRAVLDALAEKKGGAGVYRDDGQVVRLVVDKELAYDSRPGVSITVWDLEGADAL